MSDATVGTIMGYLRMDRSDWDTEVDAAKQKANELGRTNPKISIKTNAAQATAQLAAVAAATKRLQDAEGTETVALSRLQALREKGITDGPKIVAAEKAVERARTSQAVAVTQLAAAEAKADAESEALSASTKRAGDSAEKSAGQMHLLRDALVLVAPAALPIAAVAGGALLGLVPAAGAAVLAIEGIKNEMASGALAGTQYGQDIAQVKTWLADLEKTAAGGVLGGVDQAVQSAGPLFTALNGDIKGISQQIGQIVGHVGPGLVSLLHDLNPLFQTMGTYLVRGSTEFDNWATSSNSVSSFVRYVQAELPQVTQFLGNLITSVSHLAQAFAPFGGGILTEMSLFMRVLDAIPVGVLRDALPPALALYGALKAYQTLTPIATDLKAALTGMAGAWTKLVGPAQTAAVEAAASAAEISAAADTAAAEVDTAGATASLGWDAMLGPIGAVVAGVGLLTAGFLHSKQASQTATSAENAYSASLDKTTQLLAAVNVQATISQLKQDKAFTQLQQLHTGNTALGVSYGDLAAAVNGSSTQYDGLIAKLQSVVTANTVVENAVSGQTSKLYGNGITAKDLIATLETLRGKLTSQQRTQILTNIATGQSTAAMGGQVKSAQQLARELDTLTSKLYANGEAQLAAQQNEESFRQGVLELKSALDKKSQSLSMNTVAGLQNRQAIQGLISDAAQQADAELKAHKPALQVIADYKQQIAFLKKHAVAAGVSSTAFDKLVKSLHLMPKQLKLKVDTDQANLTISNLQTRLASIDGGQYYETVTVNTTTGTKHPGVPHAASGAFIHGPGTGTSDTAGLWALSNGEAVIPAASVAKHRQIVQALIAGHLASGGVVGATSTAKAKDLVSTLNTDMHNLFAALTGTAAQIAAAAKALYDAAQASGASSKQLRQVAAEEKQLNADAEKRDKLRNRLGTAPTAPTAYDRLATAQQNLANERSTVANAVRGSFDISTAGTGPSGSGKVSFGSILAQATQAAATEKKFSSQLRKLAKEGINSSLLAQLAAAGPSAEPEALALASATPKQIAALSQQWNSLSASGKSLGNYVGQKMYGAQVSNAKNDVKHLKESIDKLGSRIDKIAARSDAAIVRAIDAGHVIKVEANGKNLLKVVQMAEKQSTRAN